MLNFFIGFAFFEAGAIFGFFVAALLNAAHAGQESTIFEENDNGTESATSCLHGRMCTTPPTTMNAALSCSSSLRRFVSEKTTKSQSP